MKLSCHRLTRSVNLFPEGAQLQQARLYRVKDKHMLLMCFFPSPKSLILLWDGENGLSFCDNFFSLKQFSRADHPLSLYLKAHLLNQRIRGVSIEGADLIFQFGPSNYCLMIKDIGLTGRVGFEVDTGSPKRFKQQLKIAQISDFDSQKAASSLKNRAVKKYQKLLKNIETDFKSAVSENILVEGILLTMNHNALAWGDSTKFSDEQMKFLKKLSSVKKIPIFNEKTFGKSLNDLHLVHKKIQRKISTTKLRLEDIKNKMESIVGEYEKQQKQLLNEDVQNAKDQNKHPKKKPGLWIQSPEGLWIRIGKTAKENSEILRQAKSNDLWFHVRGFAGGHVWVPRGQATFGAKQKLSQETLQWVAGFALKYSKAKNASFAAVDYTEKKYLKRIKGTAEGLVKVIKSKTIEIRNENKGNS